ncbi:hypothetical protein D9M72_361830 [compost metagenome]
MPALQSDDIAQRKLEFEDLLDRNDALPGTDAGSQAVQHGGLPGLRRPGDQDIESAGYCSAKEPGRLRSQGAKLHEMFEPAGLDHELADVDRPVSPRHIRNDDVQPGSVGEGRIYKRRRHIKPAPRGFQHAFHQVPHLLVRETKRGEFGFAVACHVDFVGCVEPNFFDGGVIQQRL